MIKQRLGAIEGLRVVAILCVVLIHTSTRILEQTSYNLTTYWVSLFLDSVTRFAVPLFFLISGFALEYSTDSKIHYGNYIKKRFSKILIPYIFWSLIYYYFVYTNNTDKLSHVFLTGNASYQLYFITTLCLFYLIFPLLHKFYTFFANPLVLTSIGVYQVILLRHDYFIKNFLLSDPVRIFILGFFFFLAGIVSSHCYDRILTFSKKWKWFLFFGSAFLATYITQEGSSNYFNTYNINAFYSSWRPSIFIYTFAITAFLLTILKNNYTNLSKLSFLVFFIHIIVLEFVWKNIGRFVSPNGYFDILFFMVVTVVSFSAAYLLHKIPHISKLIG